MSTAKGVATRPYIVGLGGTLRPSSSTESALRIALDEAQSAGAQTELFGGSDLARLPMYDPESENVDEAVRLVESLRRADGSSSPRRVTTGPSRDWSRTRSTTSRTCARIRARIFGRAVGCVTTAYGWQAAVTTLQTLRSIVHALRGWPTPLGAAINSATTRISYGRNQRTGSASSCAPWDVKCACGVSPLPRSPADWRQPTAESVLGGAIAAAARRRHHRVLS